MTCSATTSAHDGLHVGLYIFFPLKQKVALCHGCRLRYLEMGARIIAERRSDPARPDRSASRAAVEGPRSPRRRLLGLPSGGLQPSPGRSASPHRTAGAN